MGTKVRSIHLDACQSEKLAAVTSDAERLFWRLQTQVDDEGRCEDDPRIIRARCVPLIDWTIAHVDQLLDELHNVRSGNDAGQGLLIRYSDSAGRSVIEVCNFDRYQHPRWPQPSKFEAPAGDPPANRPQPAGESPEIRRHELSRVELSRVEMSRGAAPASTGSPMSTADLAARHLLRPTDFTDELEGHVLGWQLAYGEEHVRMVLDSTNAKVRYPSELGKLIESRLPDDDKPGRIRPELAEAHRNRDCELCHGSLMATDDDGAYPCPTCNP